MKLIPKAFIIAFMIFGLELVISLYSGWTTAQTGITINTDGTITPLTAPLKHTGNYYILTGDLNEEIWLRRSNVVLDGNGYTDNGPISITDGSNVTVQNWIIKAGGDISLTHVSDVSILNNTLTSGHIPLYEIGGIAVSNSTSVTIIGNTIINGDFGVMLSQSQDNLIERNNITDISNSPWFVSEPGYYAAGITIYNSSNNIIYHNNFINDVHGAGIRDNNSANRWDNGFASGGNYWNDYQSKYPNASEIDTSSEWNTPYLIDVNNKDNYPLINQIEINAPPSIPTPSKTPTQLLQPTPSKNPSPTLSPIPSVTASTVITPSESPTQTPTIELPQSASPTAVPSHNPQSFAMIIDISAFLMALLAVAILLAVYFRKAKNKNRLI